MWFIVFVAGVAVGVTFSDKIKAAAASLVAFVKR